MSSTAERIKSKIADVLKTVSGTGNVYTMALFITDAQTMRNFMICEGVLNATFISRQQSVNGENPSELAEGGTIATHFEETYEVQILRAYEFSPPSGREASELEIHRTAEAVRAAFDTEGVRKEFIASAIAYDTPEIIEEATVDYNGQGVLLSSAKLQMRVLTT